MGCHNTERKLPSALKLPPTTCRSIAIRRFCTVDARRIGHLPGCAVYSAQHGGCQSVKGFARSANSGKGLQDRRRESAVLDWLQGEHMSVVARVVREFHEGAEAVTLARRSAYLPGPKSDMSDRATDDANCDP